jgi:hypothetical protein
MAAHASHALVVGHGPSVTRFEKNADQQQFN